MFGAKSAKVEDNIPERAAIARSDQDTYMVNI